MIDEIVKVGTTSKIIEVWLADSSSTTGAGLTGLAFNTASLSAYYSREDQGNVGASAITLATMTKGTWATGGFVEKDATNEPGVYQFSIPDAVLAAGAKWAKIQFKGASNLAPKVIHVALTAIDLYDTVRAGMTALPNAAAEAAGGLYTRGAGAGQLNQTANGELAVATLTKTLTTYTGNTPQTGDAFLRIGANGVSLSAIPDLAGITTLLARLTATRAGLLDNLDAAISSRLATAGYTAPPSAASIRAEIDSNSTQLAAVIAALGIIDDFVDTEVAAILAQVPADLGAAYNNLSHLQATKLMLAILCGKSTGLAGATAHFRKLDDSGDALSTSIDIDGNRGVPTLSP